tara:strand:- start:8671 stop:9579 length:909 start_codon:yes stop_codon:yes gene_type:complete
LGSDLNFNFNIGDVQMSTQITTAFVQQFSSNITLLSTQKGSRLRGSVDEESVTGEKAFFDQIGSVAAIERTTRHGDTPLVETPHSRRMAVMSTFEWADLIDDADKVRLLADPTSVYAQTAANAMGKAMDDKIIAAATGTALTGKAGATSTTMLSANQIAHGSADLTLAKLLSAKEILDAADVDPDIPRYIAVAPAQISALLNTTQVTSSDFNTVKALSQGLVDSFLGFKFIVSNRLTVASSIRKCFAWAEDGIKLAVGKDVMAKIDERADKSYSTQVYYCATFGSTRMEEAKVVEINCDESA